MKVYERRRPKDGNKWCELRAALAAVSKLMEETELKEYITPLGYKYKYRIFPVLERIQLIAEECIEKDVTREELNKFINKVLEEL